MKRCAGLLAPVVVAVVAGTGSAGNYIPPPGDCCPQWSPNGTQIVFAGNRQDGQRDWIGCGKPGYKKRDVVSADKIDVIAPSCNVVHLR